MIVKTYEEVLSNEDKYIIVDVRSESEYLESTIPNSINIPILNDEERKIVGTTYKQVSKKEAVQTALKLMGPRLQDIFVEFEKLLEKNKQILVFCARGGMRSNTTTAFFKALGFPTVKLDMGYKGYRAYVNKQLPILLKEKKLITLCGKTGCGKTNILKELLKNNVDILDLEKCANHRGSLLGSVGIGKCNSQKQFESLVFDSLRKSKSKYIFSELESKRIGNIVMPNYMETSLFDSYKILVETSLNTRVKVIYDEYIGNNLDKAGILNAFDKLERYISKERMDKYRLMLDNEEYNDLIEELMIKYYDIAYKDKVSNYDLVISGDNIQTAVNDLIDYLNKK